MQDNETAEKNIFLLAYVSELDQETSKQNIWQSKASPELVPRILHYFTGQTL